MAKLTKNRKESLTKFDAEKMYSLNEASDNAIIFHDGSNNTNKIFLNSIYAIDHIDGSCRHPRFR